MFASRFTRYSRLVHRHAPVLKIRRCFSDKSYDALNILFCGADEFSIYSLRAIHKLQQQRRDCIASIDVVCRPDKRVGRGLKKIQEVPIKGVAKELELPVHQIDTFTGWSPPSPIDLVIAVSFGLLVPSRILTGAKYGGINVHPSMLPDLRGPAPIQHALLRGRTHTGVSLQTMHPTRFDHGMIIAQSPPPGIPIPKDCTPHQLVEKLGEDGARMLVEGVESGLFVSHVPRVDASGMKFEHAPKITAEDRHIDWTTWTADQVVRYDRVLGRLWDKTTYSDRIPQSDKKPKRVTFHGPWKIIPPEEVPDLARSAEPGRPVLWKRDGIKESTLLLPTRDRHLLTPASATIEGEPKGKGLPVLTR